MLLRHLIANSRQISASMGEHVNHRKIARIALLIVLLGTLPAFAASCESLSSLKLPDTTINSAQSVSGGRFTPPNSGNQPVPSVFKNLPAFCRVTAEVKPTNESDNKLEVWMPQSGFNGNCRGDGNGCFAGRRN